MWEKRIYSLFMLPRKIPRFASCTFHQQNAAYSASPACIRRYKFQLNICFITEVRDANAS